MMCDFYFRKNKSADTNIRRRVAEDQRISEQQAYVDRGQAILNHARWYESRSLRKTERDAARRDEMMKAENEAAGLVFVANRRAKLKKLFEMEQQQYEKELNTLGLSIVADLP